LPFSRRRGSPSMTMGRMLMAAKYNDGPCGATLRRRVGQAY